MDIKSILNKKGNKIVKIASGSTVEAATKIMIESKVGAVLVVNDEFSPIGIFTERDNLKVTANGHLDPKLIRVDDCMTSDLVVGTPEDSVEETMALMTEKRVRHLPIVTDNGLAGVVSIGDMVKSVSEAYKTEIKYLKDYITS
jgi:CBS domain-containing protein